WTTTFSSASSGPACSQASVPWRAWPRPARPPSHIARSTGKTPRS
ncbi:MAG: hypothetical protein AVDCRST_MAG85-1068, partial [uncultured Solirubrobacteraceae bacterium]